MDEFIELVQKMRSAQIDYFKSRNKFSLYISKKLEKYVDEYILEYLNKKK